MFDSLEAPCRLDLEVRCEDPELVRLEIGSWGFFRVFIEADGSKFFRHLLSLDRRLTVLL
jgi:hypothetical protein